MPETTLEHRLAAVEVRQAAMDQKLDMLLAQFRTGVGVIRGVTWATAVFLGLVGAAAWFADRIPNWLR